MYLNNEDANQITTTLEIEPQHEMYLKRRSLLIIASLRKIELRTLDVLYLGHTQYLFTYFH